MPRDRLPHQHLPSAEDGGYVADIPDLKHCSAFGATPEVTPAEVQLAKAAWLLAAQDAPPSRYRPAIYQVS